MTDAYNCLTWIVTGVIFCPCTWVHIIFCLVSKYKKKSSECVTHILASLKVQSIKKRWNGFPRSWIRLITCSSINYMGHLQSTGMVSNTGYRFMKSVLFLVSSERDADSLWSQLKIYSAYYCISLWTLMQWLPKTKVPAVSNSALRVSGKVLVPIFRVPVFVSWFYLLHFLKRSEIVYCLLQ